MEVKGDPNDFMLMYNTLSKDEPLYKTIRKVITDLQSDKIMGTRLKREQIPKYYIKKHDINAIYKVNLPDYWRLVYGITAIHGEKKAIMMELFNHEKYNKRFGY